jgi:O-antigen/teichoic acid export membrane protein
LKSVIKRIRSNPLLIDSFWAVSGNVLTKGLAFISAIIVARFLGKDFYGEYGLLRNIVINIGMLSTFGLGYTATKFIAETTDLKKRLLIIRTSLGISVTISTVIALILFLFSETIAVDYLELPHLSIYLKVVAGWLILNAITLTQTGILAGLGAFKLMAKYNLYIGLATFLLTLIGVYWYGFSGAIAALVASQILNTLLFAYLIHRYSGKGKTKHAFDLYKEMVFFSTPLALQEIVYSISGILTYIIILRCSNRGQLGVFNAAMQWSGIILFIPSILRNVMLKHFSAHNNDLESLKHIVKRSLLLNFMLTTIPVMFLLFCFPLISSLYGKSFTGLFLPVLFLLIGTIFMSLNTVYNQFYMSVNRNWPMFWMRLGRDGGILLFGYFGIVSNIAPPAAAMAIAYLVANILYFLGLLLLFENIKPCLASNK